LLVTLHSIEVSVVTLKSVDRIGRTVVIRSQGRVLVVAQLNSIPLEVPNVNRVAVTPGSRPLFCISLDRYTTLLQSTRHLAQIGRGDRQAIMIQISRPVTHRLLVGFRKQVNDHTVIDPDAREEYLSSAILLDSIGLEPE